MMKTGFLKTICTTVVIGLLGLLLAQQRLLLVEARRISIFQANRILAAEVYLRHGNSCEATEILFNTGKTYMNYLLYRRVLYEEVIDVARPYVLANKNKLPPDYLKEIDDYQEDVYKKCHLGAAPNYYNLIDQWLLPKLFLSFVPECPDGEVRRYKNW